MLERVYRNWLHVIIGGHMYEISVEETFDAAHCLPGNEGVCSRLHGHTYRVRATFRTPELNVAGIAVDFREAKQAVRLAVAPLDHQYINELPAFANQAATAENIARFVFDQIARSRSDLWSVTVYETPTSSATYYREPS